MSETYTVVLTANKNKIEVNKVFQASKDKPLTQIDKRRFTRLLLNTVDSFKTK